VTIQPKAWPSNQRLDHQTKDLTIPPKPDHPTKGLSMTIQSKTNASFPPRRSFPQFLIVWTEKIAWYTPCAYAPTKFSWWGYFTKAFFPTVSSGDDKRPQGGRLTPFV
jgi:hypothetical protein